MGEITIEKTFLTKLLSFVKFTSMVSVVYY